MNQEMQVFIERQFKAIVVNKAVAIIDQQIEEVLSANQAIMDKIVTVEYVEPS